MKTFDIVDGVVQVKSEELGGSFKVNSEKLDILREYCDVVDGILDFWSGKSIECEVVGEKNYIVVSIVVAALTIDETNKVVCDLIERAVVFAVGNTSDNDLRIDFTFPSVWDNEQTGEE